MDPNDIDAEAIFGALEGIVPAGEVSTVMTLTGTKDDGSGALRIVSTVDQDASILAFTLALMSFGVTPESFARLHKALSEATSLRVQHTELVGHG